MQYKRIVRHFAAFRRAIAHIDAQRPAKNDVTREEMVNAAKRKSLMRTIKWLWSAAPGYKPFTSMRERKSLAPHFLKKR